MDDFIVELALMAYTNEPCRICGRLLTMDDMHNGAVFAGYSPDNKSRAAHKTCFENARAVVGEQEARLAVEITDLRRQLEQTQIKNARLRVALSNLLEACYQADAIEELCDLIDGSLLDDASDALKQE